MPDSDFVDYYELLQISPNAELETIHRVYKMLATRYHPDNTETGDLSRFLLLNQAYETLCDHQRRSSYNALYEEHKVQLIGLFETKEFSIGVDGEANRRMGILCLLYNRRRSNMEHPGLSLLDLERLMSFPREYISFAVWYLRDRGFIQMGENSDYVLTAEGADHVESNSPRNGVFHKLLRA